MNERHVIQLEILEVQKPKEVFRTKNIIAQVVRFRFDKVGKTQKSQASLLLKELSEETADSFFITISKASEKYNISKSTLYRWCSKKLINYKMIKGVRHLEISSLEEYINSKV